MPALTRLLGDRGAIITFAGATAIRWLGLLWAATSITWLWSVLIGFSSAR